MKEDQENNSAPDIEESAGKESGIPEQNAETAVQEEWAVDESAAKSAALAAENKKLQDQFLRLAAEFDNYRKRTDRDMQSFISMANFDLMVKLLPALDDLDRILAAGQQGGEPETLLDGITLLHKNMLKSFQDGGLEPMQPVGKAFDPMLHDALLHLEVPDTQPNIVIEEHKKGYFFKGRVLRPAQVVVSK